MGRLLKIFVFAFIVITLGGCLPSESPSTLPPVSSGNNASDPGDEAPLSPGALVPLDLKTNPVITYQGKTND